ncbi:MAG: hypothetical protein ACREQY_10815, partial [Candidatus Binatia bacterium]
AHERQRKSRSTREENVMKLLAAASAFVLTASLDVSASDAQLRRADLDRERSIGAIATHVRVGGPLFTDTLFPVYVAVLVWGGLFLREPRLRALIPVKQ